MPSLRPKGFQWRLPLLLCSLLTIAESKKGSGQELSEYQEIFIPLTEWRVPMPVVGEDPHYTN